MKPIYPMKGLSAQDHYQINETGDAGFYPVGAFKFWHGGINLTFKKGTPYEEDKETPIRAIADGTIVAYRITDDYCVFEETFQEGGKEVSYIDKSRSCSNNFVLIKHVLTLHNDYPVEFYSLYTHLLPYGKYKDQYDKGKISILNRWETTLTTDEDGKGIELKDEDNKIIGLIPYGGFVYRVPGDDGRFTDKTKTKYKAVDGQFGYGFVYFTSGTFQQIGSTNKYKCVYKKDQHNSIPLGINVRKGPLSSAEVIAVLPKNTKLKFKAPEKAITKQGKPVKGYTELEGTFPYIRVNSLNGNQTLEDVPGYVFLSEKRVKSVRDPIVSTDSEKKQIQQVNLEVAAGDVVGWPGHDGMSTNASIHVEVFTKREAFNRFYNNPAGYGKPDSVYKIAQGTVFYKQDLPSTLQGKEIPKDAILELKEQVSEVEGSYREIKGVTEVTGWVDKGDLDYIKGTETKTPIYAEYYLTKTLEYGWTGNNMSAPKNLYMKLIYEGEKKTKVFLLAKSNTNNARKIRYPLPANDVITFTGWVAKKQLATQTLYENKTKCRYRVKEDIKTIYSRNPDEIVFKVDRLTSKEDLLVLKNDCVTKTDHQGKQWIGIPKAAVDTDPWLDPADYEKNAKLAWVAVESLEPMNVCNWDLFFKKVSETGSELSQDGFCDVKAITDLIPDSNKDNRLDGKDIKAVLTDEKVKYQLRNFVVEHPSEWYYSGTINDRKWKRLTTDSSILNRLMKEEDEYPAFLETVRKLSFLDQVNGFTENEKLWYFHPIAFVQHLKRLFDSQITVDIIKQIMTRAKDENINKYLPHINEACDLFEINTKLRQAHFLAQVALETGELRYMTEGGSSFTGDRDTYRGRGLLQLTHKKHYESFQKYIRENETGDYGSVDLINHPEKIADDAKLAVYSSGWYWLIGRGKALLNKAADKDDIYWVSVYINGRKAQTNPYYPDKDEEPNHMEKRASYWKKAKKAFGL